MYFIFQISDEEKNEITNELNASSRVNAVTNFYKVHFTEALDLVRSRRVFLKGGFAYVPEADLVVIILSLFRTKLSHALVVRRILLMMYIL
jgi:DNA primase large subunit